MSPHPYLGPEAATPALTVPIDRPFHRMDHYGPKRQPKPDPRDEARAADRAAWGNWGNTRHRAAFREFLPDAPVGRHLTRDDAAQYLTQIIAVIEMQQWSWYELEQLRRLRRTWEKRARGEDRLSEPPTTSIGGCLLRTSDVSPKVEEIILWLSLIELKVGVDMLVTT